GYKIFYSAIIPAPLLVLGFNPTWLTFRVFGGSSRFVVEGARCVVEMLKARGLLGWVLSRHPVPARTTSRDRAYGFAA
ncbi:hypothetical protein, partial [Cellulomonas composti]|uniref:hypothetical protein n=1 Tax=Cellulomonas composti TaxID=266130 RepID=UPI001C98EF3B